MSTRSCTPGMTLLTPAFTAVASRSSATFLPPLPMMTPASLVETSERRVRTSLPAGDGERDSCWSAAKNVCEFGGAPADRERERRTVLDLGWSLCRHGGGGGGLEGKRRKWEENGKKNGRLRSRGEVCQGIRVRYLNGLGRALNASITLAWHPASPARPKADYASCLTHDLEHSQRVLPPQRKTEIRTVVLYK